jgi:hypothetical protein
MQRSMIFASVVCGAVVLAAVTPAGAITVPDLTSTCTSTNGNNGCFRINNQNTTATNNSNNSPIGTVISGVASGPGGGQSSGTAIKGFANGTGVGVMGISTAGTGVFGSSNGGTIQGGVFGFAGPSSGGAPGVLAVNTDPEDLSALSAYRVTSWSFSGGPGAYATNGTAVLAQGGHTAVDAVTGGNGSVPNPFAASAGIRATNLVTDCSGFGFECAAVVGQVADLNQAWAGKFLGDVDVEGDGYFLNETFVASDARLKTNIRDLRYGLAQILQLRPVTYNRRDDRGDGRTKIGVIAQELEKVLPEAVTTKRASGLKLVAYDEMIPVAVKAIQEQESTIRRQAAIIQQLDARIAALEKGKPLASSSGLHPLEVSSVGVALLLPVTILFGRRRQDRKPSS